MSEGFTLRMIYDKWCESWIPQVFAAKSSFVLTVRSWVLGLEDTPWKSMHNFLNAYVAKIDGINNVSQCCPIYSIACIFTYSHNLLSLYHHR